jgi:uncharacterized membrane-anchored protein YitT (DUF2179 family)
LSVWLNVFKPIPGLTDDVFLAAVFGGIILGTGVGIIIRSGGALDGTEMIAIMINNQTTLSVGEMVMIINVFILSSAGLVFGWDKAMYSLIAYFLAFKVIDIIIEGLDEAKAVIIVSNKGEEIADAITKGLGRGVTFFEGRGGYSKSKHTILYSVVMRLEVAKLKDIIYEMDENAFVTINDVSDVMGGKHKKSAIN